MSMRTSPYVNNTLFISLPLVEFFFSHGNIGTYKIGEAPSA